jgi:hypothetical protein
MPLVAMAARMVHCIPEWSVKHEAGLPLPFFIAQAMHPRVINLTSLQHHPYPAPSLHAARQSGLNRSGTFLLW